MEIDRKIVAMRVNLPFFFFFDNKYLNGGRFSIEDKEGGDRSTARNRNAHLRKDALSRSGDEGTNEMFDVVFNRS